MKMVINKVLSVFMVLALHLSYACSVNDAFRKCQSKPMKTSVDTLTVCSFNIQFLGLFKNRENEALVELLKSYDLVVIQEMVAPPVAGTYPNGSSYRADPESFDFHRGMTQQGFSFWLSEEDTGPKKNHVGSSASEWWIVYYKSERVVPDSVERNYGFLSKQRVGHPNLDRVPYAFAFASADHTLDFTLIPVHLNPGDSQADRARRTEELEEINRWINEQKESNSDFLVLGDFNISDKDELEDQLIQLSWFDSLAVHALNADCEATNSKRYESKAKGKPYDHVFYAPTTQEDLVSGSFEVLDLKQLVGDVSTYDHDVFRTRYSDHLPIVFSFISGKDSD